MAVSLKHLPHTPTPMHYYQMIASLPSDSSPLYTADGGGFHGIVQYSELSPVHNAVRGELVGGKEVLVTQSDTTPHSHNA